MDYKKSFCLLGVVFVFLTLWCLTSSYANMPPPSILDIPDLEHQYRSRIDDLANDSGALGDFFKLKKAEQELRAGNVKEAFKTVNRVETNEVFGFWKSLIQAEIYISQNEPRQTLALLKVLPKTPNPENSFGESTYQDLFKRALLARYQAKKILGETSQEEIASLLSLYPEDSKILTILGPSANATLNAQQKIDKVHALHFSYQFKKIPGILSPSEILSAKISLEEKCKALYELGNGLRYTPGQGGASASAFKEILNNDCGDNYIPRALYWVGSLNGTAESGENSRVSALTRLYKDYPTHRLADDAIYKLYQSAEKNGDTQGASKYLDLLIAHGKGDMRGKALFDMAYPLFKKGDYKKALSWLDKILSGEYTTDESYPQALYWHGRTLEKISAKNKEKARQNYQKLLKEFPYSFYTTLAAKRLGVAASSPKLPQMTGTVPSEGKDFFALIDEMNARKLSDAASAVMDIAINLHPDWQKNHEEYIAKKFIQSHNYRKALDMADKHFDCGVYGPVTGSNDPLFAAFYPMAYRDQAHAGYSKSSLPLGAIEGIMREESLFQRNVRSHAGAVGLMQLMPATARMMSRTVGGETLLDLTDPQSNILLGSAYLHDMKNYFKGQMPLAIMAYNAGPGNVNKWLRTVGSKELDEFIEDIPLSETRGYVKRVMRSMQVYGFLYNEPYFKNPSFEFQIQVAKK